MAQQVVTELVIDGSGATEGANVFSQAMAGAEQAASSGVASVTGFNSSLLLLAGGAGAAALGVKGLLDYVASANKDLADMATVAHQVELTLTDFQGIQFGGALSGLSTDQINAGLSKSASLLNDASRNSNSLSKELDANGISVKNANGQLISENQLLQIAGNLIVNAKSPGDENAIATMLGYTKEWIPLLEQVGTTGMSGIASAAQAAGVIIDDATIQKAQDFDTEWRKSSVSWTAYMKAAIADVLPEVDDLIQKAAGFIATLAKARPSTAAPDPFLDNNNSLDRTVGNVARGALNAVGINPDAGIEIKLAPEVTQGWSDFTSALQQKFSDLQQNATDGVKQQIEELDAWWHDKAIDPAFVANAVPRLLNTVTNGQFPAAPVSVGLTPAPSSYPVSQDPMNSAAYTKSGPKDFDALQKAQDAAQDALQDAASGGGSIVASKDVANDPIDRAINQLEKHTQQQIADTQAVGLGDAALAQFRAEATETAAVLANGGKETDAQSDAFQDLQEKAAAAAGALAQAKVAGAAQFGASTAFLGSGDAAIASQLKPLIGPGGAYADLTSALNGAEAAQLRFNAGAKELSSSIENDLVGGLTDIVDGTKSAGQGFADLGLAVVKSLDQMIIKIAVVEPLMKALQASISGSGLGGLFTGFSGATNADGSISGAVGATSVGGAPLVGLHDGGIVGSEATFKRYVHPAHFNDAPRFHTGGIAGDEVPIIAKKGEGVFTPGQMAAMGGGSPQPITVNLIEDSSRAGQVQQSQTQGGGININAFVDSITAKNVANPGSATRQTLAQAGKVASR